MTGEQNNKFSLSLIRLRAAFAVVTVWTAFTFPRVESGVDRRRGGERKWSPLSRERESCVTHGLGLCSIK